MIISHKHRYLFIEIPLTASWAIRHELCEYYGGEPLLHKHASYPEFEGIASEEEKEYFTFATIRNPLDMAVSHFFKYKTNHKGAYTNPKSLEAGIVEKTDIEKYRFIQETNAEFEHYFLRYNHRPFSNTIDLSAGRLDFVIYFENLQEDFSEVLRQLALTQVRPIPLMNKTRSRKADWQTYYGPASISRAKRKYGPFMRRWGYDFPPQWGPTKVSAWEEFTYQSLARARKLYLTKIRYNSGFVGRSARSARAALMR